MLSSTSLRAFADELCKLASSRLSKFVREAPVEELSEAVNRLLGTAPSTSYRYGLLNPQLKALRSGKEPSREVLLKQLRGRLKGSWRHGDPIGPLSKANREFAKSLPERAKSRLVRVSHGGSLPELEQLARHGPNASTSAPVPGAAGRLEEVGAFFHKPTDPLADRVRGYAAQRAGYAGGSPAVLEADVPEGLLTEAGRIGGGEWVLPRSLWHHAQNVTVKPLGDK